MTTIYKVVLSPSQTEYHLPEGAQVLSAREQGSEICLWYLCNPERQKVTRRFRVFGTGHPIGALSGRLRFVGTAHLDGGRFVFHVFEEAAP